MNTKKEGEMVIKWVDMVDAASWTDGHDVAYTRAQFEHMGFYPPKAGWLKTIVGKTVTREWYDRLVFLGSVNAKQLRKMKKEALRKTKPN